MGDRREAVSFCRRDVDFTLTLLNRNSDHRAMLFDPSTFLKAAALIHSPLASEIRKSLPDRGVTAMMILLKEAEQSLMRQLLVAERLLYQ
jgi:hypothetical protein